MKSGRSSRSAVRPAPRVVWATTPRSPASMRASSRNPQGQLVVEDLGSTNGTYVNGQRISGAQCSTRATRSRWAARRSASRAEPPAVAGHRDRRGARRHAARAPGRSAARRCARRPGGPPTAQTQPAWRPRARVAPVAPAGSGRLPAASGWPRRSGRQQQEHGRIALIAGLIAAVIIGAVVLALVLSGGDDDKDDSTQASQASTPSTFTMDTSSVDRPRETTTTEETTTEETTEEHGDRWQPARASTRRTSRSSSSRAARTAADRSRRATARSTRSSRSTTSIEFLDIIEKANKTGKFPPKVKKIIQKCA